MGMEYFQKFVLKRIKIGEDNVNGKSKIKQIEGGVFQPI